jgi:ankyrin repeat protein
MIVSLHKDIYPLIISFVNEREYYSSVLLTCKEFNFIGYKCLYLNFNVHDVIVWASEHNKLSLLDKLLKISNINSFGYPAIGSASRKGHVEIVKRLLQDPRVDPTVDGQYAIKFASINGHYKVVKLLLKDHRVGKVIP